MEIKEIYRLATQGAYKEYKDAQKELDENPNDASLKLKEQKAWDVWMEVTKEWYEMQFGRLED